MIAIGSGSEFDRYLSGEVLYGDDLTQEEIDAWFADEAEGYFGLVQATGRQYAYAYHALNERHGYSLLRAGRFAHVLGIGSAFGDELSPILGRSDRISILEPSDGFKREFLEGVPVSYVKPCSSGVLPFGDATVDLVTCFGVLHHIPNVSKVVKEFFRVLRPGGYALVREPIVSMGDWRHARAGLTKHERGIPLPLLQDMVRVAGFEVLSERKCIFALTSRLRRVMTRPVFNSSLVAALDEAVSKLPVWSTTYHARHVWEKLRPTSVFAVLRKPV